MILKRVLVTQRDSAGAIGAPIAIVDGLVSAQSALEIVMNGAQIIHPASEHHGRYGLAPALLSTTAFAEPRNLERAELEVSFPSGPIFFRRHASVD